MEKLFQARSILIIAVVFILTLLAPGLFSTELGEPLLILSHDYGFFSGDYYTWSTCRGVGKTIEIFVENAVWDSSITDDSYSLPSNHLKVLEPDSKGGLYIGTSDGLAYYKDDSFTDLSTKIKENIVDLSYNTSTNVLWATTAKGLYKVDSDTTLLVFKEKDALPLTVVNSENDTVWFGSAVGLCKLYKLGADADTVVYYPAVDTLNSPVSNVINDIELDELGHPWLATDKGISYLDTAGTWQVISSLDNLVSDNVFDITLSEDGIWVGTDKGLAFYLNDTSYTNYGSKGSGLTTNSINKVKLNNSVRWIATGDGLFRFEGQFDWRHFGMDHTNYLESHTTDTLNSLDIRDIAFIDDNVYLATSWGLTRYGISDGSWETWRGFYNDKSFSVDSVLVDAVLESWDTKTPGLDPTHYFYNGMAQALGVEPGYDTLGIYDEITTLFGNISDVDSNGKVSIFLLDIRDYWDDEAGGLDGLGDLTFDGFFDKRNLYSVEPTMRKEILYIDARRQSQEEIEMALANTLTKHILYNLDSREETWLLEGFGLLSEILVGYVNQNIGFKGFDKLNFPCSNSILSWQNANPYLDRQFSELLLLFTAEQYQSGDDGGLGVLRDIAQDAEYQGVEAFNAILADFGTNDTFSDLFFNLCITAVIEQQKLSTMPDHPIYNFSYHTIGSITEYNTIYWGKNNQDSPPYLGILPSWSCRLFNGRTLWCDALEKFRLLKFNGKDIGNFRIAIVMSTGSKPDTSTKVIEIPLDEENEAICSFLDSLESFNAKTYSILYIADYGDGTEVMQMVMSQDPVSPDAFGGVGIGVVQNPVEERLLDIYVTSFEQLYRDVGDAAFVDDGGEVSVISSTDTTIVPMGKLLEDESIGDKLVPYTFTYGDSTYKDTLDFSKYYLYHSEYTIPADGNYTVKVIGQDVSGNDAESCKMDVTVATVGSIAKTISHSGGELFIDFGVESVKGKHCVVISPVEVSEIGKSLNKSSENSSFISIGSGETLLSGVYRVGPSNLILEKPSTIRFAFNISNLSPEDRAYVGICRYENGKWLNLPTKIDPAGFLISESEKLGVFAIRKGTEMVCNEMLPREYALHQNYPNPFNPITKIQFDLPDDAIVTIKIYNALGELVSELTKECYYTAGYHLVEWDGKNLIGENVSSGIYFCSIKANKFTATRKMVLIR